MESMLVYVMPIAGWKDILSCHPKTEKCIELPPAAAAAVGDCCLVLIKREYAWKWNLCRHAQLLPLLSFERRNV